jgi:hypothetical protein
LTRAEILGENPFYIGKEVNVMGSCSGFILLKMGMAYGWKFGEHR